MQPWWRVPLICWQRRLFRPELLLRHSSTWACMSDSGSKVMLRRLLAAAVSVATLGASDPPVVLWSSMPAAPNQTVLVTGANFGVSLCTLRCEAGDAGVAVLTLPAVEVSPTSASFIWPHDEAIGAPRQCAIACADGKSSTSFVLHAAEPWWCQGSTDSGRYNRSTGRPSGSEVASSGGTIRVFGRHLGGASGQLVASAGSQKNVALSLVQALSSDNTAVFRVPSDVTPAPTVTWQVAVRNGGGAWVTAPDTVIIRTDSVFDYTKVFSVQQHGLDGALRAAAAAGGGVVLFPPGRFQMNGSLNLPHQTVLKVRKRISFAPFYTTNDQFTNTGSGQT